ncbi:MAG TPA: hypothetical protein VF631_10280 [Allosphingosinicella sp.]|jgi:hypothetical protein|uniref:hypothetical protein n=1 Tax=Allosphingosinicella sp. TaxID=2823234 RepID=UPI002F28647D
MLNKVLAAGLAVASGAAQADQKAPPETTVQDLRAVNLPLVMEPIDIAQKSDPIWAKGDRPKDNLIASVALRPVAGVLADEDVGQGAGKPLLLAVRGSGFDSVEELPAEGKERFYCTAGKAERAGKIVCLQDADVDGRFETLSVGLAEAGGSVEQLSILSRAEPLPKPIAYRPAPAEALPRFAAEYRNCDKDHDRPRYSFSTKRPQIDMEELIEMRADRNTDPAKIRAMMERLMLMRTGAPCVAADPIGDGDAMRPAAVPKGGVAARLGELVIAVGPKHAAAVQLVGLRTPGRLYRIDMGAVKELAGHLTTQQNVLAIQQKFEQPVLMTTGVPRVHEGERGVGDVLLEAGFAHGYMGVLTQETTIRTLLSSRSLPKGTTLYGIPMSMQRVLTMRGVPMPSFPRAGTPSADDFRLVWCVPVEDEGKWTATCLPDQGGAYTLLKGQQPAFEVTGLRYSAETSSNSGAPPVERQAGNFGKPLGYRFKLKSLSDSEILVTQETLFGETVVHSREHRVPRAKGGRSGLLFGSGGLVLTDGAGPDKIEVRKLGEFKPGADARVSSGVLSRDEKEKVPGPPVAP